MIREAGVEGHFLHIKDGLNQGRGSGHDCIWRYNTPPDQGDTRGAPTGDANVVNRQRRVWGLFIHIHIHLKDLMLRWPCCGYFPDPTKSILVVSEKNLSWAQYVFRGMGLQVVTDNR